MQAEDVIKIAKAIQNTSSLITLHIGDSNIGVEAADDIATVLSHSNKLQGLFLYESNLQTEVIQIIGTSL